MCTILVKPAFEKFPDKIVEYIQNAALRNGADKDGMGIMYKDIKTNHISFWRSIDTYAIWELQQIITSLKEREEDYEVAIHFRNATSGGVSIHNTHPIPISYGAEYIKKEEVDKCKVPVLMHNGILSSYSQAGSKYSDTFRFAYSMRYLANKKAIHNRIVGIVAMHPSNKICVMYPDDLMHVYGEGWLRINNSAMLASNTLYLNAANHYAY